MFSFWNNLRITQRFMLVLGAFVLSILAVAATGLTGLSSARDSLQTIYEESMARILLANESIEQTIDNRMEILLAFQHDPNSELSAIHDHPVSQHLDAIKANQEKANEIHKKMEHGIVDPKERQLFDAAMAARGPWRQELNKAITAVEENRYTADVMAAFLAAGRKEGKLVTDTMHTLREYQVAQANASYRAAEEHYRNALWVFGGAVLVLVLPSILLALGLLGRLRQGFSQANTEISHIAGSDLSNTISRDQDQSEIGTMMLQMETMRANLAQVVARVRDGTASIALASSEVAAGSLDLSSRTEQQASALEETASATEQLSGTVQQNADSAVQANQLAAQAKQMAQQGGAVVGQVVQTMEAINQSANKIVDIIGVIDGIAFQTNILALNAAVEAARAGEQGRGFAVVAGEVRSLAQRSAEAAREVKELITDSVNKAQAGNAQAAEAGQAMEQIMSGIQRVAGIVDEIALASREQASGLSQINQAVAHLDGVTQQNAALVEQSSAAASSLQQQASELADLARTFKLAAGEAGGAGRPLALGHQS